MDLTQIGKAIRSARRQHRMSQRQYAQHLGINRNRLSRLEADAGRQPLEVVAMVLERSGFQLTLRPVAGGLGADEREDLEPAAHYELSDAAGRRLPAHCDPYPLNTPHSWWFVRNGGWVTRATQPSWSYECPARSHPRQRQISAADAADGSAERLTARPADSRPADSRPADSRPADSRPADSRPAAADQLRSGPVPHV